MCDPTFAYAAIAISGAISAKSKYETGKFKDKQANYNAAILENQAVEVKNKARIVENEERQKSLQLRSKQRAIAASRGAQVDFGTALSNVKDTEMLSRVTSMRIREEGDLTANALISQAAMQRASGKRARRQGTLGAIGTLIGSAGAIGLGVMNAGAAGVSPKWLSNFGIGKASSGPIDYSHFSFLKG